MRLFTYILVILTINHYNVGEAAKILALFHIPSPSHLILAQPLFKALASKGHEVTVVNAYPMKTPLKNYREVILEELHPFKDQYMASMLKTNSSMMDLLASVITMSPALSDLVLSSEKVQNLKSEHFDLVIQNIIFSDPLLGLAHHFKAPVIGFGTVGSNIFSNGFVGNPYPLSYLPSMTTTFSATGMTFWNRVLNVLLATTSQLFILLQNYGSNKVYLKHFPDGPPLEDLKMNVSLVFVNAHYSIESPRPYVPNLIPVGGIQIQEPKKLPKDLKEHLDNAKNGAVLFSLGSNFQIKDLGEDKVKAIMNTLGNLKMSVLFKSDEDLKDVPPNVMVSKWLPQNDILAHPNIKLFISHGGLLSTTEAIYHAVPILGIPLFGDQKQNVHVAAASGYAVQVTPDELTEETFSKAVDDILNNPKYRENIKLKSSLLRDQPIKPLDLAVFWVEHVLKHKGAAHLKNGGAKLTWYQYHLYDVLAFLGFVTLIISYIGFVILRKIVRCLLGRKCCKKTKTQTKKKNE